MRTWYSCKLLTMKQKNISLTKVCVCLTACSINGVQSSSIWNFSLNNSMQHILHTADSTKLHRTHALQQHCVPMCLSQWNVSEVAANPRLGVGVGGVGGWKGGRGRGRGSNSRTTHPLSHLNAHLCSKEALWGRVKSLPCDWDCPYMALQDLAYIQLSITFPACGSVYYSHNCNLQTWLFTFPMP